MQARMENMVEEAGAADERRRGDEVQERRESERLQMNSIKELHAKIKDMT